MMSDDINNDIWYKLDNAGKLYPSIATDRYTTVFRLSATLYEEVNVEFLQVALDHIMKRLPYYLVNLKRGFFWYYFEKSPTLPKVERERYYPCIYLPFRNSGNFPFRVLYYNRRISLEMTHCLTDGTGAMIFLKSLVAEYFRLKGIEPEGADDIFRVDEEPDPGEYEDGFKRYYEPATEELPKLENAMHYPFPLTDRGMYHIITGVMPVKKVLARAKETGTSLTGFLLSIYFEAVLDFINETPAYLKSSLLKPVTMNIPVNLRTIFPSKTMRNFFLGITPTIDPREGFLTFEKIVESVTAQFKSGLQKEQLLPYLERNVKNETSIFIRLLPLILKDTLMPAIYLLLGENLFTSGISNLGRVTMPAPLESLIERFDFYPPPSRGNKIKAALLSYKENLYISFGSLTRVRVIEKLFFRKLVKMGIPVKVESGY